MKKLTAFIFAIAVLNVSIAVIPAVDGSNPVLFLKATDIMIPVGKTGQKISLADFSKLTPKEYEKIANVKLNFFDRIGYKMAMKKLRKGIAADGTLKTKRLKKMFGKTATDGSSGFHLGGFALGFWGSLLGVLIAYVAFSDENKSNRIKWSWIGFCVGLVLGIIFIIAVADSLRGLGG